MLVCGARIHGPLLDLKVVIFFSEFDQKVYGFLMIMHLQIIIREYAYDPILNIIKKTEVLDLYST